MLYKSLCLLSIFGRHKDAHVASYSTIIRGYKRGMILYDATYVVGLEHASDYLGLKRCT